MTGPMYVSSMPQRGLRCKRWVGQVGAGERGC
jgi:hypothetical protein